MRAASLFLLLLVSAIVPAMAADPEPAWESPLDGIPERLLVLVRDGAADLLIVGLEQSIEARAADDGRQLWTRADLPGTGLMAGSAVPARQLGWAGATAADGPAQLLVLSAETGETLRAFELYGRPIGPPGRLTPRGFDEPLWFVPLADGVLELRSDDGTVAQRAGLPGALHPPLLTIADAVAAWVGDEPILTPVLGWPRRRAPRRAVATSAFTSGEWLVAGVERSLTTWRCRFNSRDKLRCRERWTQHLAGPVVARGLLLDERAIVGSLDTYLYAFDLESGHLVWRRSVGQRVVAPPRAWTDPASGETLLLIVPDDSAQFVLVRAADGSIPHRVEGNDRTELYIPNAQIVRASDGPRAVLASLSLANQGVTLRAWDLAAIVADSDTENGTGTRDPEHKKAEPRANPPGAPQID